MKYVLNYDLKKKRFFLLRIFIYLFHLLDSNQRHHVYNELNDWHKEFVQIQEDDHQTQLNLYLN
jgi:hypothetical protein